MISITDTAVKNLLQSRFKMPAIYSDESSAMDESYDMRYQLPTGFLNEDGTTLNPKVVFPFCIWTRQSGNIDMERYNEMRARFGVYTGFESEDRTKARYLKMIPMNYPYGIRYYVSSVAQSVRLEKLYWGLKIDFSIPLDYPPSSDDRLNNVIVRISSLAGFGPPKTDTIYSKGRYYTNTMNFNVDTWIVEGIDIPLVQEVLIKTYDHNAITQMDEYNYEEKFWKGF
jgi:hypothetical protein